MGFVNKILEPLRLQLKSICLTAKYTVVSTAIMKEYAVYTSMGPGRKIHSTTTFQELLQPFYDLGLYLKFQSNPIWPYYGSLPPPRSRSTDSRFGPCFQYKPFLGQKQFKIEKIHDRWNKFFKPYKT